MSKTKVNLKARINRHTKVIKNNMTEIHPFIAFYRKASVFFVLFAMAVVLPFYPLLMSVTTQAQFDRKIIDETTIISSFDAGDLWPDTTNSINEIFSTDSEYISVETILDDNRDLDGVNDVIEYTVKEGDTLTSLASKYNVTIDSITWANESLKNSAKLKVWSVIKIPPVSGLIHEVLENESLDSLAKQYKIAKDEIVKQNEIEGQLVLGETLIIPGATKYKSQTKGYNTTYNNGTWGYAFAKSSKNSGQSKYVNNGDYAYKLTRRKPKHSFVWWNCTRFVGQYKDVTWWGNAKDWLRNAKKKGAETWIDPKAGAVIVFYGKGYNPRYGHVAIVVDVKDSTIIVKDMNYRRLNEVTTREIPKTDKAISGYIYVP